jgi:hypothetical protein
MTERDIPESWYHTRSRESDEMTRLSRNQHISKTYNSGGPATGSTSKSVKRSKNSNSEQIPSENQPKDNFPTSVNSGKFPGWLKSWVLWTFLLTLVPGGIAFVSTAMLLKLPSAPNCPSIFWPLASASVRLHCAQLAASKQTVKDLLQAISFVKEMPKSHPLRGEIDRNIEQWSRDILQLANQSFQAGKLQQAIATAREVPEDVAAYELVEKEISEWLSIWSKAEGIYEEAEAELREQHWHQAFMIAAKLLRVDNKYWATVKYDEMNRLIVTAREDGDKLAKAKDLAETGLIDNLLKAINLAESISRESYVYQKAREVIPEYGREILEFAQAKLDKQNADEAIEIAQKIPATTGLEREITDFVTLAEAQRNAWNGTISGLETAIYSAQQIEPTRPGYEKAQKLIASWQVEIEDISRLEKARLLANQGTVSDLTAAIAEAELIPVSNPRGKEAKQEIDRWVARIQTIEDQPYLERAEQIASFNDISSLQTAIAEASQIGRGRALYEEARRKIAMWTDQIQRIEDQPYLEQAQAMARSGDLPAAIAIAQQIPPRRALSGEARTAINDWQREIRARENWKRAREVALIGTPETLIEAIKVANRVPRRSSIRYDVNIAIDQWSLQLLDIARAQSISDIPRAIETAKLIPRYTTAYSTAQEQIRAWQEFLNPQPVVEPSFPLPEFEEPSTNLQRTIEGQRY